MSQGGPSNQGSPPKWSVPRVAQRYLMDQRLLIRAGSILHGRTKDISETGIGATIAGEVDVGEMVELEFHLTGSLKLYKIKAEVKYRQGFQYGLHFLDISEADKDGIRKAAIHLELVR